MNDLTNIKERYIGYLKNERGYSAHTISAYQRTLGHLIERLAEQKITSWQNVTPQHLTEWLTSFRRKGLKPASIQAKVSSVKGLFAYLIQKQVITVDPSELLTAPKNGRALPKNMAVDEVSTLLAFPTETTIAKRDKAIMELFYSSGLRLSELAACQLDDLDTNERQIKVLGKGNRQRIVPIGSVALKALDQWLSVRHEFNKYQLDDLFISKLGNRISIRQIDQRLKYWAKHQGIQNVVHPHKLRHSFASHMLESSSDLRAVQELLGHQNLSTTQIYTHLDYQHLANIYDGAHPRAKKRDS